MPTETIDLSKASQILYLLGDPMRLTMLKTLQTRESCARELIEIFNMSQPAISRYLRKFRNIGLVIEERKGKWIYFSINKKNEYYPFIESILAHLPNHDELITELEVEAIRICFR